jgi:hypothetical protein
MRRPLCQDLLADFSLRIERRHISQLALYMNIGVLAVVLGLTQPIADMPTIEVTPHVQVPAGLAQRASKFIDEYFRHLSSPDVLSKFQQDYGGYIDYYGKVVNRAMVMQEKASFVHRWPQREYRSRQDSLVVSCMNEAERLCVVTGLVDFECRSSERHAVSNGVARFKAAIFFEGEEPRIVGEDSEVLG